MVVALVKQNIQPSCDITENF